jgi:hypothetical protein
MIELLSTAGVYLAGVYLCGLGVVAFAAPALATRFLLGHAGTATVHYLELALRAAVGAAFLAHAPSMRFSAVFLGFGWVLVATTAALAVRSAIRPPGGPLPPSPRRRIAPDGIVRPLRRRLRCGLTVFSATRSPFARSPPHARIAAASRSPAVRHLVERFNRR